MKTKIISILVSTVLFTGIALAQPLGPSPMDDPTGKKLLQGNYDAKFHNLTITGTQGTTGSTGNAIIGGTLTVGGEIIGGDNITIVDGTLTSSDVTTGSITASDGSTFGSTVGITGALGVTGAITGQSTITSAATGSLGWSYVTGANTACTATCTKAAVFGVDLAAGASQPVIVGPADATADACICAGAS